MPSIRFLGGDLNKPENDDPSIAEPIELSAA
jgi:hypothetical protein